MVRRQRQPDALARFRAVARPPLLAAFRLGPGEDLLDDDFFVVVLRAVDFFAPERPPLRDALLPPFPAVFRVALFFVAFFVAFLAAFFVAFLVAFLVLFFAVFFAAFFVVFPVAFFAVFFEALPVVPEPDDEALPPFFAAFFPPPFLPLPLFFAPPSCLLTVAQAMRSASSVERPFDFSLFSICSACRFCLPV